MLSFSDRVELVTGVKARRDMRQIARAIGRSASMVSRELVRHGLWAGPTAQ
ncbi:helix-turn-helix domain-containing protein [Isoptericola jiangsuensis]|uniref:helix-turn-helix domain-containing protein n=1 Tax=Isoptericola jiangsuensis TaxID=548579 RepID=UPI001474045D